MLWKFPPDHGLVWLFSDILDLLPIERSNPCNFRRWFCLARIRNVVFTRSVSLYGSRRKILRSVKISIDRIHSQSASIRGGSPNGKIVENSSHSLYIETELADGCSASTIQSYRKLSLLQIWRKIQNETGIRYLDRAVAESWKFKVEIREVREIWSLLSSLLATGLGPRNSTHPPFSKESCSIFLTFTALLMQFSLFGVDQYSQVREPRLGDSLQLLLSAVCSPLSVVRI